MEKEAVSVQLLIVLSAPPMLLPNAILVQLAFILLDKQFAKHVFKVVMTVLLASHSHNINVTHVVMDTTWMLETKYADNASGRTAKPVRMLETVPYVVPAKQDFQSMLIMIVLVLLVIVRGVLQMQANVKSVKMGSTFQILQLAQHVLVIVKIARRLGSLRPNADNVC